MSHSKEALIITLTATILVLWCHGQMKNKVISCNKVQSSFFNQESDNCCKSDFFSDLVDSYKKKLNLQNFLLTKTELKIVSGKKSRKQLNFSSLKAKSKEIKRASWLLGSTVKSKHFSEVPLKFVRMWNRDLAAGHSCLFALEVFRGGNL